MSVVEFPFVLILLFVIFISVRPLTTVIHEFGHAIPYMLFTREKVSVFIGLYGLDGSKSFTLGLLKIYFNPNPLKWGKGLCVPSNIKHLPAHAHVICILSGTCASFLIALVSFYVAITFELHGSIKFVLFVFLGSSLFDLITNLSPSRSPVKLQDGEVTYNDGYLLLHYLKYRKYTKIILEVTKLSEQNKYAEAASILSNMIDYGNKDILIFQMAIASYIQAKDYDSAKVLVEDCIKNCKMKSDDYVNASVVYLRLEQYDIALAHCNSALNLNPNNVYGLNNKGHILNKLERYEEAVPLLDRAIIINKDFAYSYNNRGYAHLKLGNHEFALLDINHSLTLDATNAYSYINLGFYHLEKGNYQDALKELQKAKELDSDAEDIDELLIKAHEKTLSYA